MSKRKSSNVLVIEIQQTFWGKCGDCGDNWDGDPIRVSMCDGCGKAYCHRCQDAHDCDGMNEDQDD